MENQASLSDKHSLIPIQSQAIEASVDCDGEMRVERNHLALQAYLIMDQGHDLQSWLEERLNDIPAHLSLS